MDAWFFFIDWLNVWQSLLEANSFVLFRPVFWMKNINLCKIIDMQSLCCTSCFIRNKCIFGGVCVVTNWQTKNGTESAKVIVVDIINWCCEQKMHFQYPPHFHPSSNIISSKAKFHIFKSRGGVYLRFLTNNHVHCAY